MSEQGHKGATENKGAPPQASALDQVVQVSMLSEESARAAVTVLLGSPLELDLFV